VDVVTMAAIVAAVEDAIDEAEDFADTVEDQINLVTQKVNRVRDTINTVITAVRTLTDVQVYPMVRDARALAYACQRLAGRVAGERPELVARSIRPLAPAAMLAHHLYGDATRADELLDLNPDIRNPFFIEGTDLTVYQT